MVSEKILDFFSRGCVIFLLNTPREEYLIDSNEWEY